MERFRWQRINLTAQHATLLRLGAFISALLLIFLINQFCESKPNSENNNGIHYKVPVMHEMTGVWL
jgi:hypothetical protein